MLPGLLLLSRLPRERRPAVVALALAIVVILAVYELAVPSQFIFARMRLAGYLTLLGLGAVGWSTTLTRRGIDASVHPRPLHQ
jgi:hypothetical protein